MPPNFTGRVEERAMLTQWLTNDATHPLLVIRALGGFGKSALAWHWLLHDVNAAQWPRVVWWSFYEGDASFEHFLRETLTYLKIDPRKTRPAPTSRMRCCKCLQRPGTLLILDGFERATARLQQHERRLSRRRCSLPCDGVAGTAKGG